MTRQEAIETGAADGIDDVETVLEEQGLHVVIATLKPGHVAWDEGAVNAGAANISGVPAELEEAYYEAYAKAARVRAQEIADDGKVAQKNRTAHA